MKINKQAKQIILIVVSLAVIAGAIVATYYFRAKGDAVVKNSSVYVPTGADYQQLLDSLGDSGKIIKEMHRFRSVAEMLKLNENVRPGHYSLKKGMSYIEIAKMFKRGLQTPIKLTFNNIRTLEQLAGRIAEQIEPDSTTLITLFRGDTTALHYGFSQPMFISMFIPNTYEVYWNITTDAFLDRMKRENDNFWNQGREQKLQEIGLSRDEAVTLASIVYEETKMSDEMATVAGVYMNRLRINMPLQADPTIKFALNDFSIKRILFSHLKVNSPYNTYLHLGLPPGPIYMPSIKAMDAVLNYQRHKYLFFCAKLDFSGYHTFAVTLAEHNRNAAEWRAALNRAGIK